MWLKYGLRNIFHETAISNNNAIKFNFIVILEETRSTSPVLSRMFFLSFGLDF